MKLEIANEFGVNLGADATARQNGAVGGEMTKRMIALAQQQLSGPLPHFHSHLSIMLINITRCPDTLLLPLPLFCLFWD